MSEPRKREPSRRLGACTAGWIKWLHAHHPTLFQHQIAAAIGTNQGRICEVLKGDRYPEAPPIEPPEEVLKRLLWV